MTDTQWPRYEVFVQEQQGEPHLEYGSVHAPDAEMALLNARDVFARRPGCTSMWVVPASAIHSRTAEELNGQANEKQPLSEAEEEPPGEVYHVACKFKPAGLLTVVGTVQAASPQAAMAQGTAVYGPKAGGKPPSVWWVFPAKKVIASDPEDIESMYNPALDKPFRLSSDFRTVSAMRQVRSGSAGDAEEGESCGIG